LRSLKSIRPLDAAILGVAALVLILGVWLGWSWWSQSQSVKSSTPVNRAIADLKKKIEKNPSNLALRMDLAQAYTVAGQDREATEQYQQVLSRSKNHIAAISGLGFIASRQGDWKQAEQYWRRATKIMEVQPTAKMSKQYETANFYLGTTLLEQKKYEEAIGFFKEALRVNRSASDTHYLLAKAFQGIDAFDEYREELEITLAFDPTMAEANYDYGLLLLKDGKDAEAAQHFRISADRAPDREEPRDALENLGPFEDRVAKARQLQKSDPEKALVEARVAAALEPKDAAVLLLLGSLYEETKEKGMAADTYRAILATDANNAKAKAALERVTDDK